MIKHMIIYIQEGGKTKNDFTLLGDTCFDNNHN